MRAALLRWRRRPHPTRLPDNDGFWQYDPGSFGQDSDGLDEGDFTDLLHELEHVTPDATAETAIDLHL